MPDKPFFVTTPIYYVNDVPHIGHAYTTVAADVFARWRRRQGDAALLLVGTDEHGAKIAEAAEAHGKSPRAYTDEVAGAFKSAWRDLDIQYGRFIRTSDSDHEAMAARVLQKLYDGGFITKGIYEGLYCVGHEKFMSPEELIRGKCPDHGRAPEPYKEENYFFALSRFGGELIRKISADEIAIRPVERKNEVLGKLKQGLEDVSISRTKVKWAIPLPFDESQTAYVWIEALFNYYTYGKPQGLWPPDLQLVGKDILWFHAIIWPAMLLALGESLPRLIFAHGFFTIAGQKMSKTLGNVITPHELVKKFGADATRYLLLSAFPFGEDGNFDWARLTEKYNADLANGIGNFAARVTTLAAGLEGIILGIDEKINQTIQPLQSEYEEAMTALNFFGAIRTIQKLVSAGDEYMNAKTPWSLEGEEQRAALKNLLGILTGVAAFSAPFMPQAARAIFDALGIEGKLNEWGKAVLKIRRGEVLFPRLG